MEECDLVMKGGTTSGVVYPLAIAKIAERYRLRSIGGTSAGAIAASLAAAAEYRRRCTPDDDFVGYRKFRDIADELAQGMTSFLQPTPEMKPVFDAFMAYLDVKREWKLLKENKEEDKKSTLKRWHFVTKPLAELSPLYANGVRNGILVAGAGVLAALWTGSTGIAVFGLFAGLGVALWQFVRNVLRDVVGQLKRQDFGILPGITQPAQDSDNTPGVIDWLADRIDQVAGLCSDGETSDRPLTMGDLDHSDKDKAINLVTITSDLTSQRPFQLPLKVDGLYFFTREEFEKVLPKRIVDWLVVKGGGRREIATVEGTKRTFYPMPTEENFPVVLAARMSLSFPLLIQAVPLWRKDNLQNVTEDQRHPWIRCLFSDGGISSNLPVHLFDAWLPRRPTFAIALGPYDQDRHGDGRVSFSKKARVPTDIEPIRIGSLFKFCAALINGAKDWQDKLQSNLPGFAERVAVIHLEPEEGGSNLNMLPEDIRRIQGYGERAGEMIVNDTNFDFDENRYRRALSILPNIEKNLQEVFTAYEIVKAGPNKTTYAELLRNHCSEEYPQDPEWIKTVLCPFVDQLSDLGRQIEEKESNQKLSAGVLPHTDASLRLVASAELTSPFDPKSVP